MASDEERAESVQKLDALLKKTRAPPNIRALSDDEILAEIVAYRQGQ